MAAFVSPDMTSASPYMVGNKIYGSGRSFPTMGPVDILGYAERDAKMYARRNAMLRRLKANQARDYANPESWRKV